MNYSLNRSQDNATDSAEYHIDSTAKVEMLLLILVMMFIVIVNILTLITVAIHRVMWTVPNMYVVSLAIADLLTGFSIIYQLLPIFPDLKPKFDSNKFLCLFKHSTLFTLVSTSILNMILIAFDRWAYVTYPFVYERLSTIKRAVILIALAWVLGILIGTVPLYVNNWRHGCRFFEVLSMEYQIYGQGSFLVVSSIIIAACYLHIFHIVRKQKAAILRQRLLIANLNQTSLVPSPRISHSSPHLSHSKASVTSMREAKLAKLQNDFDLVKMFGLVFGVFFCCCSPALILGIVTYSTGKYKDATIYTIPIVVLNSGMNFIIYILRSSQFRQAVKATCFGCRHVVNEPVWAVMVSSPYTSSRTRVTCDSF
ncbi:beta-1 adrenergic receptor-like [Gigantopelta aegis]|uniref:beta-1 adrenergic receptor-like n=1 Tax=Gigantopelta aegis TaxID=1735272 RepID=UPI001B88E4E3|nr:beta-1 adrenergic receptor-like [Gigantopelta aegis]